MHNKRSKSLATYEALQERSHRRVADHIAARSSITRSQFEARTEAEAKPGQRAADAVARFGGSWTFIIVFALVLCGWVLLNSVLLARHGSQGFDPYPYILLNLFLSMLAAIQAPVILMSQNRQSERIARTRATTMKLTSRPSLKSCRCTKKWTRSKSASGTS